MYSISFNFKHTSSKMVGLITYETNTLLLRHQRGSNEGDQLPVSIIAHLPKFQLYPLATHKSVAIKEIYIVVDTSINIVMCRFFGQYFFLLNAVRVFVYFSI